MRNFIFLGMTFFTQFAIASNVSESITYSELHTQELVAALVRSAKSIRYGVGTLHGGPVAYDKKDISEIIASNLANEMAVEKGKSFITNTTSSCREGSLDHAGVQSQSCSVTFNHVQYIVRDDGFKSMKLPAVSSVILNFEIVKTIGPDTKLRIKDNKVGIFLLAREGGNE